MNLSIRTIVYINTECYNVSMIEGKLYNGRMPTNANEVVITTEIADKFIDSTQLNNYEELIGLKVNDYTICGLVKSDKNIFTGWIPMIIYQVHMRLNQQAIQWKV